MTATIPAVYANGVFRPLQVPALQDGTPVELTVCTEIQPRREVVAVKTGPLSDDDLIKAIQATKTLKELFALMAQQSPENGDYDVDRRLAESRGYVGEWPPQ